ncbi:MAG TPA: AtpZ/AtpI family protein [Candidatus Saccharibacteria bacterium]|nr:AtpZ/AtpI family protein [Candidatus Saccharibacteria bacterium]
MSTSGDNSGGTPTPPVRRAVLLMLGDIADTTWRMFGPVVVLTGLGLWADSSYDTGPWLSLAGVLIGSAGAALLVKQQLTKVNQQK